MDKSDSELEKMATVDGVACNSEVRRRVILQINQYKNFLSCYNPDKYTSAALMRNKDRWMNKIEDKFENVTKALSHIEMEEDIDQGDSDDVVKLLAAMSDLQVDFVMRYEAKCDAEPAAPVQPAAGLFPGLQLPAPLTNAASNAQSVASGLSEQVLAKRAQNLVIVESEDIRDKIQKIHSEFTKVRNWSSAEDHIIELEMTKVKGWKERMEEITEKLNIVRVKCGEITCKVYVVMSG